MSDILFFAWKNEYCTNITSIDNQHKELVKLINDLYQEALVNRSDKGVAEIIQKLLQYVDYHFRLEESMMKKANFPNLSEHIKTHKEFEKKIYIYKNYHKEKLPVNFQLLSFLKTWLANHILGTDREYIPYIKE